MKAQVIKTKLGIMIVKSATMVKSQSGRYVITVIFSRINESEKSGEGKKHFSRITVNNHKDFDVIKNSKNLLVDAKRAIEEGVQDHVNDSLNRPKKDSRYTLEPFYIPNTFIITDFYICTDTINKIVCKFEAHNFNDNQEFTLLEDCTVNANLLATLAKDMGDWLRENHYDKLF